MLLVITDSHANLKFPIAKPKIPHANLKFPIPQLILIVIQIGNTEFKHKENVVGQTLVTVID